MHFSYDKLWKLLIDKKINKQKLKEISKVSSASMAKLGKGQNIVISLIGNLDIVKANQLYGVIGYQSAFFD